MHLMRERPRAPASILPRPTPLPNLRGALARRADIFGSFDGDDVLPVPRGTVRLGTAVCRIVDRLAAQVSA